jgi:hypothetical protein
MNYLKKKDIIKTLIKFVDSFSIFQKTLTFKSIYKSTNYEKNNESSTICVLSFPS